MAMCITKMSTLRSYTGSRIGTNLGVCGCVKLGLCSRKQLVDIFMSVTNKKKAKINLLEDIKRDE
jgi:hypothetical protein